jgi:hypothetical protein
MVRRIVMPPSSGLAVHVVTACTRTFCNMPENESLAILLWELRILQVFLQFNYCNCNLLFVLIWYVEFVCCILNYRFIGNALIVNANKWCTKFSATVHQTNISDKQFSQLLFSKVIKCLATVLRASFWSLTVLLLMIEVFLKMTLCLWVFPSFPKDS